MTHTRNLLGSRVAAVLVNWRAAEMTLRAVDGLLQQTCPPATIYVVENGSGDTSIDILQSGLAARAPQTKLIVSDRNLGFGGGCNLAIRDILQNDYDYVWLVNNDAVPVTGCLEALIEEARRLGSSAGIVGSWLVDPDETAEGHYGSWMHPADMRCSAVTSRVDLDANRYSWVTAASMLVSVPALRSEGMFDEAFFMYWEDADLNMRIRDGGYTISVAADAMVHHSAGTSSADIPVRRYLWHYQSQRLWLCKHHGYPALARAALAVKFLAKALLDRDIERFRQLVKALQ